MEDLQENLPHLNEVHLFSDNAGCYKSATTLLLLKSQIGSKLKSYNFSEAHDGKGIQPYFTALTNVTSNWIFYTFLKVSPEIYFSKGN